MNSAVTSSRARGSGASFERTEARPSILSHSIPGARDFKLDEWHEYHLTAIGEKLSLRVNGRLIAETTDNDADSAEARGILALQLHTGPPMKVQFRNVRLKASPSKATPRDRLIAGAALHWQPGERADAHQPLLKAVGEITPGIVVDGARVGRLRNAYFDAALDFNQPKAWNAPGEALTVFLRARVPDGNWTTALFSKRGGHDTCNFNCSATISQRRPGRISASRCIPTAAGFPRASR